MLNSVVYIASLSCRLDAFADSVSAIKRQKPHHKDRKCLKQEKHTILKCLSKELHDQTSKKLNSLNYRKGNEYIEADHHNAILV